MQAADPPPFSPHTPCTASPPLTPPSKGSQSFPRYPVTKGFLGRLLEHLQMWAGGSKSATVAKEIVTDVSKFLHFSDATEVRPQLLVSRKAIVAYSGRLEKAGVKVSGQQMKLARLQTVAPFLLLEEDGKEGEAELYVPPHFTCLPAHFHPLFQPGRREVEAVGNPADQLQATGPQRSVEVSQVGEVDRLHHPPPAGRAEHRGGSLRRP